jgi:ribosomal protein S18 acetylase RimI-like enzyme
LPRRSAASYLAAPPPDAAELRGFPRALLAPGTEIHRIHSTALGAWYFSGEETWRFNPCGIPGLGACYFAERAVAGLLESYKGATVVAEQDVAAKAHFTATLEAELKLADCCAATALRFGLNAEIHSTTDYELTQPWATAFSAAGFAGMRYFCRSDPSMALVGYAILDAAGEAPPDRWPTGHDRPIGEALVREAEGYGLRIRPTP